MRDHIAWIVTSPICETVCEWVGNQWICWTYCY
jgi:hypothetical protein